VPDWQPLAISALAALALYAGGVIGLISVGRRTDAVALARFVPDCVVLFRRLLADRRVPRRRKLLLAHLLLYLVTPLDLVPDFIPVAGALDDAILIALVLRSLARGGGADLLREHWRGPARSLDVLLRLAYGRTAEVSTRST
jgi:uncharacterized membrane protein YkvA (DUF1232 family)